ncbi:CASP-like protein 4A3 [Tanacetum coccineum]
MRGFLWCQGNLRKGSAKVSWEVVCLPKDEGGLGVKRLNHFNKALMVSHIWKLLSLKESLWVRWIHVYRLKGHSFWDIPHRGNMTWGWRKILQLWPLIREFIWYNIGDGSRISIWFDRWCSHSPLSTIISPHDIFRSGFDLTDDKSDCLEWRDGAGVGKPFSVHLVWNTIRLRDIKVAWFDIVWFPNCTPRHAFNMWLIIKKCLKTQDSLNSWDVLAGLSNIWSHFKRFAGIRSSDTSLGSIFHASCLLLSERNRRLFKRNKRSTKEVIECIMASVRLKLLSCHFKKSRDGVMFARLWDLPEAIFNN